MRYVQMILVY